MRTSLLTILLCLIGFTVTGCNTTRGIGQDVKATGEAIEEVAEETKDELND